MTSLQFIFLLQLSVSAYEIPVNYYESASGYAGERLKTELHQLIKGGTRLSYGSGAGKTWSGFEKTDRHPEGHCWDMYSNNKRHFPGNAGSISGMNIEHSVAKSWWGGSSNHAYKDLYHLNPSDAAANSARNNYPLGEVREGSGSMTGTLRIGDNAYGNEYNDLCFEPLDEYKGDFARAYMYMFTAYENYEWSSRAESMLYTNQTYPMLRPWAAQMLLEWSRNDPPSAKEQKRAAEIYKIQHNRNPFIDFPELAEYLWGEQKGNPFFFTESTDPMIPLPAANEIIEFDSVHFEATTQQTIRVMGKNLTAPINVQLSGADADLFSLTTTQVSIEEAHAGYDLIVTFSPQRAVASQATLTFSSAPAKDKVITLKGVATEQFEALSATAIQSSSFMANWTTSSLTTNFKLEVYTKELRGDALIEILDASFVNDMPTGWSEDGVGYVEVDGQGARLGSSSRAGKIISPLITTDKGGKIQILSKKWEGDSRVTLTIYMGSKFVAEFEVESTDYKIYEVEFPKMEGTHPISIASQKGKRAFVKEVNASVGGLAITEIPVMGYPLRVENTRSYLVNGLQPNTDYFYRITPDIEPFVVSAEISVKTLDVTGLEQSIVEQINISTNGTSICVENLPQEAYVRLYSLKGQCLASQKATASHLVLSAGSDKIYILQVVTPEGNATYKVAIQ